jgi:hypothetical protein
MDKKTEPESPRRVTLEDLVFIAPVVKAVVQSHQDALAAANNRDRRGRRLSFKPGLRLMKK